MRMPKKRSNFESTRGGEETLDNHFEDACWYVWVIQVEEWEIMIKLNRNNQGERSTNWINSIFSNQFNFTVEHDDVALLLTKNLITSRNFLSVNQYAFFLFYFLELGFKYRIEMIARAVFISYESYETNVVKRSIHHACVDEPSFSEPI